MQLGDRRDHDGAVADGRSSHRRAWPVLGGESPAAPVLAADALLALRGRDQLRQRLARSCLGLRRAATRSCGRRGPARSARRLPDRARACRCRSDPARRRCGTGPAPWRTLRPARRARRGARSASGSPASRRRSGRSAGRAELGAMLPIVARSASGSPTRPSPKNSTNLPTTPLLAQHARDREHQVGRGRAFRQRAVSSKPTTCGISM